MGSFRDEWTVFPDVCSDAAELLCDASISGCRGGAEENASRRDVPQRFLHHLHLFPSPINAILSAHRTSPQSPS